MVIEWLDPIMIAGHWVPEMVDLAGGEMMNPDILIISPCGFDIVRTLKEKVLVNKIIQGISGLQGVYLVDGNAFMTRPGPRIVDGVEILAEILHPEIFPKKHSERDWQEFMIL